MSIQCSSWWLMAILALAVFTAPMATMAEEGAADAVGEDAAATDDAGDENENEEVDPFAVPETDDSNELLKFIDEVRSNRPPRPRGPAEYREFVNYMKKAPEAIAAAAKRIVEIEKDTPNSDAAVKAQAVLLEEKVRTIAQADDNEREKTYAEVYAKLKESGITKDNIGMAHGMAQLLERVDPKLAGKAYMEIGQLVAASDDEEISGLANHFEGPGRRLSLLGNKMEVLTGTTLSGKEFDWDSYRGKVVLVDFWATWCGPCVAEIPNVLEAYEKYHDDGFEVVGISLDRSREPLEKFVDKKELPWTQLYQDEGRNEMAEYYGISAIPTVILVDRDGKVVSTNARGATLERLLKEQFPDDSSSEKENE